jgi:hypothetical protein
MTQAPAIRTSINRVLGVLCIVLVFALGTAQAVHSHPVDSQRTHHSCSICSAPSIGPPGVTVDLVPTAKPVGVACSPRESFVAFRPVLTNFVRPPPAV